MNGDMSAIKLFEDRVMEIWLNYYARLLREGVTNLDYLDIQTRDDELEKCLYAIERLQIITSYVV